MGLYYLLPALVLLATGTAINFFLTTVMGNRYASLWRSFAFALAKLAWLCFLAAFFWDYEYLAVPLITGYYLLFLRIFHAHPVRSLRFLVFSTAFGISAKLIVFPRFMDFGAQFIY